MVVLALPALHASPATVLEAPESGSRIAPVDVGRAGETWTVILYDMNQAVGGKRGG
jgi:hypothetical protein